MTGRGPADGRRPLDGVRIFDLTIFMVGPWASMLLGALGADVLHVEQPDIDWKDLSAGVPPTINGTSIGYITWNMNKRGLFLDLKLDRDRELAHQLVRTCDVFLCNMRSGVPERLGMGYEQLAAINPRLVYVRGTGYGRQGPRSGDRAADMVVQSLTGFWSTQGRRGSPGEAYRHYTQLDAVTGNTMAQAALLGLYDRRRTGSGQMIDVTMFDAAATLQAPRLAEHMAGITHEPMGSSAFATAPDRAFCCEDGRWIGVSVTAETEWAALCRAVGQPGLAGDRRYRTNRDRVAHRAALEAHLVPIFAERPQSYWIHTLARSGVPFGTPLGWEELRQHRQVRDNDYLVEVDTPAWGRVWTGGPPWHLSKTPARMGSPPIPGNDTFDIRAEATAGAPAGADRPATVGPGPVPAEGRSRSDGPLAGVRVVEVAEGVAGPMAARLLGDAGADVIKVETAEGDRARGWGPPDVDGTSVVFTALNRNKRSVLVGDVTGPEVAELVGRADVLVVDDGRLDIAALMARWPDLVVCAVSGWGPDGPWAGRPGGELPAQLASEASSSLGVIGEEPVRLGNDHAGMVTASFAVQGVVAALLARDEVGGQRVDVSLFGSLLQMRSTLWVALSDPDEWWGFHLDSYVKPPEHGYTGKDRRFYFSVGRVADRDRLVEELRMEWVKEDPRWDLFRVDTAGGTGRHSHLVHDLWDRGLAQWTYEEAAAIIESHGGWVFPYLDYEEFLTDEHVAGMGLVVDGRTAEGAPTREIRPPWQLGAAPASIRRPAPRLGADTAALLGEAGPTDRWEPR